MTLSFPLPIATFHIGCFLRCARPRPCRTAPTTLRKDGSLQCAFPHGGGERQRLPNGPVFFLPYHGQSGISAEA